jgi:hypothetical protein
MPTERKGTVGAWWYRNGNGTVVAAHGSEDDAGVVRARCTRRQCELAQAGRVAQFLC